MAEHQKHTQLQKPGFGTFGRLEVSIMGTPCGNIKKLARSLVANLDGFHTAYIDADHASGDDTPDPAVSLTHGAIREYTDKIHYNQINFQGEFDKFQRRKYFQNADLVIVNGNHFPADRQILVIDPKKDLAKKIDKITNVAAIVKIEEGVEVPAFLRDRLGDSLDQIPVFTFENTDGIAQLLRDLIGNSIPPIWGLVLGGGKSTRMAADKGLLNYHGKPQREHAWELLSKFTKETYFSCRQDQAAELPSHLNPLIDTFEGLGPFGGILSAFRFNPKIAWMTIAVDLPLLDEEMLQSLLDNRNPSKLATSFLDPQEEFPEPLITIWEPKAYPEMLYFLSQGYSCPRKVLINSDTEVIKAPDTRKLMNVNEPAEYEEILAQLQTS